MKLFTYLIIFIVLPAFCGINAIAQCPAGDLEVTIEVKTDNYGYEAYWELLPAANNCGNGAIFTGGNTAVGCNGGGNQSQNPGGYGNNATYIEGPWCLTGGGNYKIFLVDDWGDGGTEFSVKIQGYPVHTFKGLSTNETFNFTVQMPPALDAALHHLHLSNYVDSGQVEIKGEIENRGQNFITSYDINYAINNGPVSTSTILNPGIAPFTEADFSHPSMWATPAIGSYDVKVWISNINGQGNDANQQNDTIETTVIVKSPRINKLDEFLLGYKFTEIANVTNNLITPRDLDFHPNGELWIVNQETENAGGSTVTIYNPGKSNQVSLYRKDGNAWHFMSLPSGIAFSNNGNFATSTSVYDANHNGGQPFTGPALWSSDSAIYAQPSGGNGSHLDMLHESPHCMGIAAETENAFWVLDAYNNDIVRYDFKADHGPGNDDHSDGEVLRYKGMTVNWINQNISSHLELDDQKEWLYIVDGGNERVLRLNINTGIQSGTPTFGPFETLALYSNVINATWEVVADTGLIEPAGIDIIEDRMLVSDHSNGNIYIYDISTMPAVRLGTIATGAAGIQGIVIGPEGNIWYVNSQNNHVKLVEPDVFSAINEPNNISKLSYYPNPTSGRLTIDKLSGSSKIFISDISGKIIIEKKSEKSLEILDLQGLSSGIYLLTVENGKGYFTDKLTITR